MKIRLLSILTALTVLTPLRAQENSPWHIGAEAGLSINNYTGSGRYVNEGFYVGIRSEYEFSSCYLSGSLRFIRKGAGSYNGDGDSDDSYRAGYIELPIAVGKKWG